MGEGEGMKTNEELIEDINAQLRLIMMRVGDIERNVDNIREALNRISIGVEGK